MAYDIAMHLDARMLQLPAVYTTEHYESPASIKLSVSSSQPG